jgi:5-formyltetrahydrofolate cyclo-ligase
MGAELAAAKRAMRRVGADRRRQVDPTQRRAAADAILRSLLRDEEFRSADRIGLYAALPDEPPTESLFQAVARDGRPRLLPRVRVDRQLEFALVERWEDLRPGRYGVLEPAPEVPAVALLAGDLVLVPGIAFDAAGARLGRGGGFYDRTFPTGRAGGPLLYGIAYELQIVDEVPHDSHDRRMNAIVTEHRLRRIGGESP